MRNKSYASMREEALNKIEDQINEYKTEKEKLEGQWHNVNNSDDVHLLQVLEELIAELEKSREEMNTVFQHVPKIGVFGNTGDGKSSFINALYGAETCPTSDTKSCTSELKRIEIKNSQGQVELILIDFPGFGEAGKHEAYVNLYKKEVADLDLVYWTHQANNRVYDAPLKVYQEIFRSGNEMPPVIFALTKSDLVAPAKDWDWDRFAPKERQQATLKEIISNFAQVWNIKDKKSIVAIAVEHEEGRYTNYNLDMLVEQAITHLPAKKRIAVMRNVEEENINNQTRKHTEESLLDIIKDFVYDVKEIGRDVVDGIKDWVSSWWRW